jgi:hypothetical protein
MCVYYAHAWCNVKWMYDNQVWLECCLDAGLLIWACLFVCLFVYLSHEALPASCQMGRHHGDRFHASLAGRSVETDSVIQYIIFFEPGSRIA